MSDLKLIDHNEYDTFDDMCNNEPIDAADVKWSSVSGHGVIEFVLVNKRLFEVDSNGTVTEIR